MMKLHALQLKKSGHQQFKWMLSWMPLTPTARKGLTFFLLFSLPLHFSLERVRLLSTFCIVVVSGDYDNE